MPEGASLRAVYDARAKQTSLFGEEPGRHACIPRMEVFSLERKTMRGYRREPERVHYFESLEDAEMDASSRVAWLPQVLR